MIKGPLAADNNEINFKSCIFLKRSYRNLRGRVPHFLKLVHRSLTWFRYPKVNQERWIIV